MEMGLRTCWCHQHSSRDAHRDEKARLGVPQLDGAPIRHGLVGALDAALRQHLPDAAVVEVGRNLGACGSVVAMVVRVV